MTLEEAAEHVGNPVLARTGPGRTIDGEVAEIDEGRRLVGLRVRYLYPARGWRPGLQWWHPAHLDVPRWWLNRQKEIA